MQIPRLKVMTLVGTRPELIKLSRVIAELDRHTDHVLVHSGQNYDYDLNEVFFSDLGIRKPDHFLDAAGQTAAEGIGLVISRADQVMEIEQPQAILFYGDTNTCLAAIAAKRRKIPVFHMEAGNRSFDERVPEEINRRIIDHISDINMPLTEHARRYLLAEGIRAETVIKTGSTMREVLDHHWSDIQSSVVLEQLSLEPGKYFVISAHREENVDDPDKLRKLLAGMSALAEQYAMPLIFSTHPRTRKRLDALGETGLDARIQFMRPLGFVDYIKLQHDAFCVLSDSGTIAEEASILDLPAVTLREAHERPEGMDDGVLVMSGLETERILQSVALVTRQHQADRRSFGEVADYGVENVSAKVVRIILSYTDYVNRTVWRK